MKPAINKPTDYAALKEYCQSQNLSYVYAAMQQEKAAKANAPVDAIYEHKDIHGKPTGTWATVADLPAGSSLRASYARRQQARKQVSR